ncbi:MAG: hypothetical protein V7K47_31095 [Nostoc sp.]
MTQDELLLLMDRAVAEGWQELDLSGQELTELPVEIGKLQQLESLILGEKVEGYEYVGDPLIEKVSGNNLKRFHSNYWVCLICVSWMLVAIL